MPDRKITGVHSGNGSGGRDQGKARSYLAKRTGLPVTGKIPRQELTPTHGKGSTLRFHHGSVRQRVAFRSRNRRTARRPTLLVEDCIHVRCGNLRPALPFGESASKSLSAVAPAIKAGAMTGRQGRHFIEEEEFGPASRSVWAVAAHHLAMPTLEIAFADDPRLSRPSSSQKPLRFRIVNDAAIAREQPSRGDCFDGSKGSDAVLQRHFVLGKPREIAPASKSNQPDFSVQRDRCKRATFTENRDGIISSLLQLFGGKLIWPAEISPQSTEAQKGNQLVTWAFYPYQIGKEMSLMRATILSLMLLTAVMVSGAGIYAATASGSYHSSDGYGISDFAR